MSNNGKCPFTGGACDGGTIHPDGTVGCGYKADAELPPEWTSSLPQGIAPRDFYNATVIGELTGA